MRSRSSRAPSSEPAKLDLPAAADDHRRLLAVLAFLLRDDDSAQGRCRLEALLEPGGCRGDGRTVWATSPAKNVGDGGRGLVTSGGSVGVSAVHRLNGVDQETAGCRNVLSETQGPTRNTSWPIVVCHRLGRNHPMISALAAPPSTTAGRYRRPDRSTGGWPPPFSSPVPRCISSRR